MSDTNSGRKAQRKPGLECLTHSESDSDHSSERPPYKTCKHDTAHPPGNDRYREALDFRMYCLKNTSSWSDDQVPPGMCQRGQTASKFRPRPASSTPLTPSPSSAFLPPNKLACDTNSIHGGAVIWFLHLFMWKQAAATLNSRIAPRANSSRKCQKKGTVTTYGKLVKKLM